MYIAPFRKIIFVLFSMLIYDNIMGQLHNQKISFWPIDDMLYKLGIIHDTSEELIRVQNEKHLR